MAHLELSHGIRLLNEGLSHFPTANPNSLRLIQQRFRLLSILIESHPGEAISLAFSPEQAGRLAAALPDAASQIESEGEWEGPAAVFVEDNFAQRTSLCTGRRRSSI